jgi:Tfp pilus assembly protein PilV
MSPCVSHFSPTKKKEKKTCAAFSLVEVVLALGVASVAVISLIGLFAYALETTQESAQAVLAANAAASILAVDRAAPTNAMANACPLPRLDQGASNFTLAPYSINPAIYLTSSGQVTNNIRYATYGFLYSVMPNATTNAAQVYMMLYWPPQASPTNGIGKYEISTQVYLP